MHEYGRVCEREDVEGGAVWVGMTAVLREYFALLCVYKCMCGHDKSVNSRLKAPIK